MSEYHTFTLSHDSKPSRVESTLNGSAKPDDSHYTFLPRHDFNNKSTYNETANLVGNTMNQSESSEQQQQQQQQHQWSSNTHLNSSDSTSTDTTSFHSFSIGMNSSTNYVYSNKSDDYNKHETIHSSSGHPLFDFLPFDHENTLMLDNVHQVNINLTLSYEHYQKNRKIEKKNEDLSFYFISY
jgi:hypothetical protein